jgi:hypothetical protein
VEFIKMLVAKKAELESVQLKAILLLCGLAPCFGGMGLVLSDKKREEDELMM